LRAVDSILAQTHSNLTLVVVNDGDASPPWDLLAHIDDPRLVRYDLGANRGRYFVDAVILAATPDPYLLIQDADDWSEPARAAALLESCQLSGTRQLSSSQPLVVGAVSACRLWREGSRAGQLLTYPALRRPLSERFQFRSDHHGLFRTDVLRQVGGNYGGYRIGYDTLLINLLGMVGQVAYVERPLYNRQVRPNSLTTSASTGMRSAQRQQVRDELAWLYSAVLHAARACRARRAAPDEVAAAIRALCQARVGDRERAEIERHAACLRELIIASQRAQQTAAVADRPSGAVHPLEAELRLLLRDPRLAWDGWSVTPAMAQRLVERLGQQQPRRILEAGSGLTTALLARYAQLTGAQVVTLEHDLRFYRQTAALLERLRLRRAVDLRLAPLGALRHNGWGPVRWYRPLPAGPFDFVFVDGPPQQLGREGTLFALAGQLSAGGELWLHNGHREHERACLAAWQRAFHFDAALVDVDKGAWILSDIRVRDHDDVAGSAAGGAS
jgi:protein-L-isoaspartate O-methyltransferase